MMPYHLSSSTITFFDAVSAEPVAISKDHPKFNEFVLSVKANDSIAVQRLLNEEHQRLREAVEGTALSARVKIQYGQVLLDGEPAHEFIGNRIVELKDAGYDVQPLVRFLERLSANPSRSVTDRLYQFLDHGKMPLTETGTFLTYKAIRSNWTDIHSGKFDNSVGQTVSIPRNKVDDDHNVPCSHGLHVCSWDYLPSFAHTAGRVVVCEVDPADVVAIPTDYNDTKMRVCRYKVIREVTDYYERKENVLASTPVEPLKPYLVRGAASRSHSWDDVDTFDRYQDAVGTAQNMLDTVYAIVQIVDTRTATVLHEITERYQVDEQIGSEWANITFFESLEDARLCAQANLPARIVDTATDETIFQDLRS